MDHGRDRMFSQTDFITKNSGRSAAHFGRVVDNYTGSQSGLPGLIEIDEAELRAGRLGNNECV